MKCIFCGAEMNNDGDKHTCYACGTIHWNFFRYGLVARLDRWEGTAFKMTADEKLYVPKDELAVQYMHDTREEWNKARELQQNCSDCVNCFNCALPLVVDCPSKQI